MRPILAVLATLLTLAGSARAVTIEDVDVADSVTVDGRTLALNGAGLRAVPVIGIDIYVAALYVPTPSHDAAAILAMPGPKVVVLHFLHAATKQQVEAQFRKGEQVNCGAGQCDSAELPDFERMIAATPAIAKGDTATYIYEANRLRVLANGRPNGDYRDGALARQLLLGFIGDHPPTERLKEKLLGLSP